MAENHGERYLLKGKGILHYAVDHTPALFHKTFTKNNSELLTPYLQQMMEGECGEALTNSIIDKVIIQFRNR